MLHATCTRGNWADYQLLVVESQIANLTPDPSFGHNLCFRCPNGSCEPISNMYVPRSFQCYKERLNPMSFNPYHCSLNIRESISNLNSQNGSSFGSVRVHPLTLFCTHGSMRCDSQASFLAHNLASFCLGHEPKVRVVTKKDIRKLFILSSFRNRRNSDYHDKIC
jgi:hypothetical protein